jgi:isocitrate dehydrogenase kinase/phosphatase
MHQSTENQARLSVTQAYQELRACALPVERIDKAARLILCIFDEFYDQLCKYPYLAQHAFEARDPQTSIRISRERLSLYSRYISEHGPAVLAAFPGLDTLDVWDALDRRLMAMIVHRYEADIAFSFAHSLRRNICRGVWRPVAYSFPVPGRRRALSMAAAHRRFPVSGGIGAAVLREALQVPAFSIPFRDLSGDVERVLARLEARFGRMGQALPVALDVVDAGFFRDRTAFLVARWVRDDGTYLPLVVAYLNGADGIYVDAVLDEVADVHNLFSSALANFHVTTRLYYQTCVLLFSLMPLRPLGLHYSTIGFNHVGKVAILNEITEQMKNTGRRFQRSPGVPGTVALGFTYQECGYHFKVIRDVPTSSYKWGEFPGVAAVVDKYRVVHEINRAGSMLDNVMYFNVKLDRGMFDLELLEEICRESAGSVQIDGEDVLIRSLIVQMKIVPMPVFLESANESDIRKVIHYLGNCIRNNAATNIFNKDLDSRNYGVGRYGRVFLFDYDAVETLTDVKIRTNLDREPGEEALPAWFFEAGVIFLPEELEYGMQLKSDFARQCFREENRDLMSVDYWLDIQQKLQRGEVPALSMYPAQCRLEAAI